MRVACQNCGKKYEVPEKHVGRKFACVKCGERIRTIQRKASTKQHEPPIHNSETPSAPPILNPVQPIAQPATPQALDPVQLQPHHNNSKSLYISIGLAGGLLIIVGSLVGIYFGSKYLRPDFANIHDAAGEINSKDGSSSVANNNSSRAGGQSKLTGFNGGSATKNNHLKSLYTSNKEPVLPPDRTVDPTILGFSPAHVEQHGIPNSLIIDWGLSFGGPWFLDIYSEGMNSKSTDDAFDSAIAAANWSHDKENAIRTLLTKLHSPQLNSDGRYSRQEYAVRMLNEYPDEVINQMAKLLREGKERAYRPCIDLIIDYRMYRDDLVDAAKQGFANYSVSETHDGIRELLGYSWSNNHRDWIAISETPGRNLLAPGSELNKNVPWKRSAYAVDYAAPVGLDLMPPMMETMHHINVAEWLKFRDKSLFESPHLTPRKVERFAKQLSIPLEKIEYITTGQQNSGEHSWKNPRLAIIKTRDVIDVSAVAAAPKDTELSDTWVLPGGTAHLLTNDTLLYGSKNEVIWVVNNKLPNYVHPAAYQWTEIRGSHFFTIHANHALAIQVKNSSLETTRARLLPFRIGKLVDSKRRNETIDRWRNDAKADEEQRRELFARLRKGVSQTDQQLQQVGNTGVSAEWIDNVRQKQALTRDILRTSGQETIHFEHAGDRIRVKTKCRVEIAEQDLDLEMMVPSGLLLPNELAELPSNEKELIAAVDSIPNSDRTGKSRTLITYFLEQVIAKINRQSEPVSAEDAAPTLQLIYELRENLGPEHIHQIAEIGSLIQFENATDQIRWTVACLVEVRTLQGLSTILEFLQLEPDQKAFDNFQVASELAELEKNYGTNHDLIQIQQKLLARMDDTCDSLGPILDYFLQYGSSETQLTCIEIAKRIPKIEKGLIYRFSQIHRTTDDPLLRELLTEYKSAEYFTFKVDSLQKDSYLPSMYTWRPEFEFPVEPGTLQLDKTELFQHRSANFTVALPIAPANQSKLKFYGTIDPIEKRDDESVEEWSARSRRIVKDEKADAYKMIEGLKFTVENSDALTVDVLPYSLDEIESYWESGTAALGDQLISEGAGDSNAPFDRYRTFMVGGIPKAQRIIAYKDRHPDDQHNKFELRWIGRSQNKHPGYVDEILNSFTVTR